ncbi:MAG: gliding motility-associated ABC transporter substrate-binding protein GldG [Flavobacteriia bacterium]|nr:gliding motility-associated ABC transporter substrate-binding protein GldG [Flavobacteriia bacterium]
MNKKRSIFHLFNWTYFFFFILFIVLVNVIASFIYFRYDATEDKRYSLAEGTVEYLQDDKHFKDRLLFKIYLEGNLPAEVRRFRNAVEDKLKEFKEYAGKRIEYQFIDPTEGSEQDRLALFENIYQKGKGIVPMELLYNKDGSQTQMMLWPGAVIEYLGSTVNYVQLIPGTPQGKYYQLNEGFEQQMQNSINNLEYILISSIRRSTQQKKEKIAFLQGHGELTYAQTQRVRTLISPYFVVEDVFLKDSLDALKEYKGLVIARPTQAFSDKDKYIIDQFLMRGGRLMCFIDKLNINKDTLKANGVTHTMRYPLELDKMLFDYGIKVNDNYVIDVRCAPMAIPSSKQPLIPWFYDVLATPTKHPISRNIEPVILRYVSEIQFVGNSNRVAQPILTSSTNSAMTGLAPLVSLSMPLTYGPKPILVQNPEDENNKLCLAGLVEGYFESHFKNRLVDAFAKNPETKYKEKSSAEGKVLVMGNGRFIENKYDSIPDKNGNWMYRAKAFNELRFDETMSNIPGMQPLVYGNQEFFQNLVDYMMGDQSVLDIRSKQIDIHALDKEKITAHATFYKWLNMSIPSLLILILAISVNYIRRRKYTRH